ncbi:glycoside hydrolase family 13 protein [Crocosphaera chwakensis]|uniref:Neopullulanase n=1 Tax=Crocosphaera chwakensis CCY0110 TaxID=391612 RepID=A3IUP0_9CHRO|nr:glycoside hydrolase family 13 protein [Crocosphaera chwakensis]EAZ89832.1 neopullulanase [Crocosphaera chwakensis CCY0110]
MAIKTPDWVKHAVFYQIYPDSFARKVPPHQKWLLDVPLEDWDAPPTYQGYKGGNLWGVMEKLDYLQDLGVTALYFTPIFRSASNHGYHTHDYYGIDPLLGDREAFDVLLKTAHDKGFKVVLDGVFNHASRGFFFFNDILENGPNSPWLDWFKIEGWPLSAYDGALPANYVSWIDYRALPQFNHDNPAVREYIMQVGEYWLKQGIDGWRLDVPDCVKAEGFWEDFRERVKGVNPEAYIVGEIAFDATQWLDGKQFDGVMNYPFGRLTAGFIIGDRVDKEIIPHFYQPYETLDAAGYAQGIEELLARHPWEIQLTQLNLLDSHDTPRFLSIANGDRTSAKLGALLLMTFPGTPNIFYGDEIGIEGGHEPDCRKGFPTEEKWDAEALAYYKQLIQIRKKYTALRTGDYHTLYSKDKVYIFGRVLGEEGLIIAVNNGETKAEITVSELDKVPSIKQTKPSNLIYGEGSTNWDNKELKLTIPARSGLILAD